MKKFFKWLGIIVLVFVLITGVFTGYVFYKMNKMQHAADIEIEKSPLTKKPFSVVLMGIDNSKKRKKQYGTTSRTDALLIATVSPESGYVSLLSIPRDTYVYQPLRGVKDKINHAYAFNGEEGTLSALSEWLGEDFQYFVTVNFDGFMEMVNALGGLEVNVPREIIEQNSQDVKGAIHLKPGLQTVNGEEALALVRMRKADTDVKRGERQMLVIQAFMNKILSASAIPTYPKLIDVASKNIKTNVPFKEAGLLGFKWITKNINPTFETFQVMGNDQYINGIYYYIPNEGSVEEQRTRIKEELNGSKNTVGEQSKTSE